MKHITKKIRDWFGRRRAGQMGIGLDAEDLFRGWFNNHMTIIFMAIQSVRERDAKTMMRMQFFLQDVEHHYIRTCASRPTREAFRYLSRYFKVYPHVNGRQCRRAVEMVARIYQAIGYEFHCQGRDRVRFKANENADRGVKTVSRNSNSGLVRISASAEEKGYVE
ncbi:MAG: hypothetical protein NC930_08610 [Candidatus Omnitrophica bacterium]|nr:hypothetical protein [Candidatus Omnitrophota bacterium]